jgi:hypothetical protein
MIKNRINILKIIFYVALTVGFLSARFEILPKYGYALFGVTLALSFFKWGFNKPQPSKAVFIPVFIVAYLGTDLCIQGFSAQTEESSRIYGELLTSLYLAIVLTTPITHLLQPEKAKSIS